MTCKDEQPKKSILKTEHEHPPSLGAYNLYAKRASFKEDVVLQQIIPDKNDDGEAKVVERLPIAPDEPEEGITPEEILKRKEFKKKRMEVDRGSADNIDLKAILAHRVLIVDQAEEEEENQSTSPNSKVKPSEGADIQKLRLGSEEES